MPADKWAGYFAGRYSGWARQVEWDEDHWEDIMGVVRVECTPAGGDDLDVVLKSLKYGTWRGRLNVGERVLRGTTGDGGTKFRFRVDESLRKDRVDLSLVGGLYDASGDVALHVSLYADGERKRPEPY